MSSPTIIECEQGSPEWKAARLGIPTASRFADVLAKGRGGAPSETRRKYLYDLAGEQITGEPAWSYSNEHMERGHEIEDEARAAYELITGADVQRVGFISCDGMGCSPDGLIGNEGMIEIKTKLPRLQLEILLEGTVPDEYFAQLQGNLFVAQRQWIDFCSYAHGMKPFIKRVVRDEPYIAALKIILADFSGELTTLVGQYNGQ